MLDEGKWAGRICSERAFDARGMHVGLGIFDCAADKATTWNRAGVGLRSEE